jgi:membrane protease YdiL (CAAX protease family)
MSVEVPMDQFQFSGDGIYEIKVRDHIDEAQRYWFEGMAISTSLDDDGAPVTTFRGSVVDQAALHGVLARIRDMNLKLISVNKIKESNQKRRKKMNNSTSTQSKDQYSLAKILGLWAAASLPMGILGWVVYPALTPDRVTDPLGAGTTRIILMGIGLIWIFVLSMLIVYREEGDLRWSSVRRRLRLNAPLDPKTDVPRRKLWLWLIPIVILSLAAQQTYGAALKNLWVRILPFLAPPAGFDPIEAIFGSPVLMAQITGNWTFGGFFLILMVFNIFGEEFFFRGVLLPKMGGVFGKWDWVANGVLFGLFHLHEPWVILPAAIDTAVTFSLPAKYFRNTWFPVIAHTAANLIIFTLVLMVVLGMM